MLRRFHIEMTHLALEDVFRPRALAKIIAANLYQDRIRGQIGHDEYHFDNNAFETSYAYIEEQRTLTTSSLRKQDAPSAWAAFGRLTHTAQDFYAHSNFVALWLDSQTDEASPSEINPLDSNLINSQDLRSGKFYVLEVLTFIPLLKPLVMRFLPRDSHGWMNLDAPERGPNFPYAFQAAVKRTKIEFERTTRDLPEELLGLFMGKSERYGQA
jgi:hypothetical protein